MERRLRKAVVTWLEQERGGDARRAEMALRRVFLRLPLPTPRPNFTQHVLARLGLLLTPASFSLRWKVAVSLCFALVALASTVMLPFLAELWTGLGASKIVELTAGFVVALSGRLAASIIIWEALVSVSTAVSASLASPTVMTVIAVAALVCALATRWLHGLLITEGNSRYVQSS